MQAAPAVAFDADDGGRWRAAVAALAGLAAAVLARWAVQWAAALDLPAASWPGTDLIAGMPAVDLIAGGAAGLAAALAAWRIGRPLPARLIWNTNDWLWQVEGRPPLAGRVQIAADLGGWMLLRFDPLVTREPSALAARWRAAGRRWIPLAAPDGAVRAALVAAAPAAGRPGLRRSP